jgi:hypothetical protein
MFARYLALFLLTFPVAVTPLMAGENIVSDVVVSEVVVPDETEDSIELPPPADIDGATPWYFDQETGEWVYVTIIDDSNVVVDGTPPEDFDPGFTEDSIEFPPPADINGATPWYFDHEKGEWVYVTIIDDSNLVDDRATPPDVDLPADEEFTVLPDEEFTKGDEGGCDGCEVFTVGVPGGDSSDTDDLEVSVRSVQPDGAAAAEDMASDMSAEPGIVVTSVEPVDPALLEELRARVEAELLRRGSGG